MGLQQGIGVTREDRLGDDMIATYKALSASTANFKDKVRTARHGDPRMI